jgi:hypothetical protein
MKSALEGNGALAFGFEGRGAGDDDSSDGSSSSSSSSSSDGGSTAKANGKGNTEKKGDKNSDENPDDDNDSKKSHKIDTEKPEEKKRREKDTNRQADSLAKQFKQAVDQVDSLVPVNIANAFNVMETRVRVINESLLTCKTNSLVAWEHVLMALYFQL